MTALYFNHQQLLAQPFHLLSETTQKLFFLPNQSNLYGHNILIRNKNHSIERKLNHRKDPIPEEEKKRSCKSQELQSRIRWGLEQEEAESASNNISNWKETGAKLRRKRRENFAKNFFIIRLLSNEAFPVKTPRGM